MVLTEPISSSAEQLRCGTPPMRHAGGRPAAARRRPGGLKFRPPPIDCSLAAVGAAAVNPFVNSECQSISERFEVLESLGQGTTAVVYRGCERSSGRQVALKVLRIQDEELLSTARHEYELLRSVEHPNIIRALDFFTYPRGAVLVLEFFEGRSLEATVAEAPGGHFTEGVACTLFAALLRAVECLHQFGILHRDVKAANVLVSTDLADLRLIDFNTARRVLDGALTMTGTADYLPPEVLLGEPHTAASDVWAAGLCLRLMLAGAPPLERKRFSSHEAFGRAVESQVEGWFDGPHLELASDQCKRVLRRCLTVDPEERPKAAELLESEWLRSGGARAGGGRVIAVQ